MQDIFDPRTIRQFQNRIQSIPTDANAQWGKMNLYQMLKHCVENEKMMLKQTQFKRLFVGRLFGKMALKANIKNDSPLKHNSPTHPALKIKEDGDVETQKNIWSQLIARYPQMGSEAYSDFVHPFFGKMTSEQVSKLAWKHIDHHLRQFGV